jgi:hypothetical protein
MSWDWPAAISSARKWYSYWPVSGFVQKEEGFAQFNTRIRHRLGLPHVKATYGTMTRTKARMD